MDRNYDVIKLIQNEYQNEYLSLMLRVSNFVNLKKFYSYLSKQHLNTQKS